MKVNLQAIVAVDNRGGIGKNNDIPWKCKADMAHFKEFTSFKTCVMGRRTFESIEKYNNQTTEKEILPHRNLIVLTSNKPPVIDRNAFKNLIFVSDLNELKQNIFAGYYGNEVCIMGGASLYEEFAPYYDAVSITEIEKDYNCSTFVDVNKLKFNRPNRPNIHGKPKIISTSDGARATVTVYGRDGDPAKRL